MRRSNAIISLSIAVLASALAACGSIVEVETSENVSAGALEKGDESSGNPDCVTDVVQRSSCVDYADLKMEAHEICTQGGMALTDLQIESACADGTAELAQYTCCLPLPAPPTVICLEGTLGDPQTCQDLGNFKLASLEACTQAGFFLVDIVVGDTGSCDPSQGLLVEYKCAAEGNVCP
jgi:hypothetical protein